MKKALFVAHAPTMTGAPMALLRLLRIIKGLNLLDVDILFINVLSKHPIDFSDYTSSIFSPSKNYNLFKRVVRKISRIDIDYVKAFNKASKYDLVVFNTVATLDYFKHEDLARLKKKVLLIYEMPTAFKLFLGANIDKLTAVDLIFSPSRELMSALIEYGIPAESIMLLNQYVEPVESNPSGDHKHQIDKAHTYTVGMIGTPEWPKGIEFFILIAKRYTERFPDLKVVFVWKGLYPEHFKYPIYSEDIRKAGLQDTVRFEGITHSVDEFYKSLDVLALSSREDTFPYVMMEAAQRSIPTICFAGSGGAEGFVKAYGGFVIPFLNIEKFVEALHHYYLDRQLLLKHGELARDFILKNHNDKKIIESQFLKGMEYLFSSP